MGHLYKFTSATGALDYFTDLDVDVIYSGPTYKSGSLRFEGLQRKISVGLSVDEQNIKIWASPTDTLFGSNFLAGAQQGLLDGATITRTRIIWPFITGNAASDVQQTPIAVWTLFTGYTAEIVEGGTSHIELKVKSALAKLNVNMPRNYYQAGCLWTLFDAGCTLSKASYAVTSTVAATPGTRTIPIAGGVPTPYGADTYPTYAQGRLQFTTGVNTGLQVLIDNNDAVNITLAYPLTNVPTVGDNITFYPGCSKSYNTCSLKFSNANNFRGFDKVPPIMVSA